MPESRSGAITSVVIIRSYLEIPLRPVTYEVSLESRMPVKRHLRVIALLGIALEDDAAGSVLAALISVLAIREVLTRSKVIEAMVPRELDALRKKLLF